MLVSSFIHGVIVGLGTALLPWLLLHHKISGLIDVSSLDLPVEDSTSLKLPSLTVSSPNKPQSGPLPLKAPPVGIINVRAPHSRNYHNGNQDSRTKPKPCTVYIITPTYRRPTQQPDLLRMSHSLRLAAPPVHWIVVEDGTNFSPWVRQLLLGSGLPHTYLAIPSKSRSVCKGVDQRNEGLRWVRENVANPDDAVIYFGDDDNTYDHRLFEEIRGTSTVGLLPVAGFPKQGVSTPVVVNGTIVALQDFWSGDRKFPLDMASLSLNGGFWEDRGRPLFRCVMSFMETRFVESLHIELEDIEPKAQNCTKILVWHTRNWPASCSPDDLKDAISKYPHSNLPVLQSSLICGRN